MHVAKPEDRLVERVIGGYDIYEILKLNDHGEWDRTRSPIVGLYPARDVARNGLERGGRVLYRNMAEPDPSMKLFDAD